MASQTKAARRLAKAFADSLGDDALEPVARDLGALAAAVRGEATLRSALANPALPADRRTAVALGVAEHLSVGEKTRRFLETLGSHEALPLIADLADAFAEARDERRGIVKASVTTAQPIDEQQRTRLRAALARLTGREVTLEANTDPSLIGGAVTRIGSTLYDGSVRSRLAGLRGRITGS